MLTESTQTVLEFLGRVPDVLRQSQSDDLINFTAPTRVEPPVLVDDRCVALPYMSNLLQTMASIFAGYYMQAAALSTASEVHGVNVVQMLDRLNPRRSLSDNAVQGLLNVGVFASESLEEDFDHEASYAYALPVPGEKTGLSVYSEEAPGVYQKFLDTFDRNPDESQDDDKGAKDVPASLSPSSDAYKAAQEMTNLAVGKLLNIQMSIHGQKFQFPVQVRMMPASAPPSGIVSLLSTPFKPRKAAARFRAWRQGQIHFIKDLVFCQDLIDAHKKNLINDTSGIYSDAIKRRRKNRLSALLTGQFSLATASAVVIMAESTRKELEREIRGRLSDFRTREKLFKETLTMLLVVVDPEWETVTIYHRSISQPTELSVSDLRHAGSGDKGPDIAEILKQYLGGSAPAAL